MKKTKKIPKHQIDMFAVVEKVKESESVFSDLQKPKGEPSAELLKAYKTTFKSKNLVFAKTKFFKEQEMPIINGGKTYGSPKSFTGSRKGIKTFKNLDLNNRKCRPIEWRLALSKFFRKAG